MIGHSLRHDDYLQTGFVSKVVRLVFVRLYGGVDEVFWREDSGIRFKEDVCYC